MTWEDVTDEMIEMDFETSEIDSNLFPSDCSDDISEIPNEHNVSLYSSNFKVSKFKTKDFSLKKETKRSRNYGTISTACASWVTNKEDTELKAKVMRKRYEFSFRIYCKVFNKVCEMSIIS